VKLTWRTNFFILFLRDYESVLHIKKPSVHIL
jgi:hypothetical protein